jgi:hypothetical protein
MRRFQDIFNYYVRVVLLLSLGLVYNIVPPE